MYESRTLCLFSIWAGQSFRKYAQSRRAATDCTAAHEVSMAARSSAFSFSLLHRWQVSAVTNQHTKNNISIREWSWMKRFTSLKEHLNRLIRAVRLKSLVTFGQRCAFLSRLQLQNARFTHLKMLCLFYTQTERSLIGDFSLHVYNRIPWWEKLQTST